MAQQSGNQKGVREARVVDAAIEEFAERGFDGTTWRSVAQRANVSQGLIKFYFNDKEGLWRAALLAAYQRLNEGLPAPPFADDPDPTVAKTADWIRSYVRHAARYPEYIKMIMREAAAPNTRLTWAVHELVRESNEKFQTGIAELQKRGYFKGLNPMLIQYAFLGAIHHPFLASEEVRTVFGVDICSDAMIEEHADAIVALFLHENSRS